MITPSNGQRGNEETNLILNKNGPKINHKNRTMILSISKLGQYLMIHGREEQRGDLF